MSKRFAITTTTERTLSEIGSCRDQAAYIAQALLILDSRNFHWLELQMKDETTRIEALREHPEADGKHEWEWPESFRVVHDKKGHRTTQEVKRGWRGAGIVTIAICGVPVREFSLTRIMRRKTFVSFSFQVGRVTKVITPHGVQGQ